MSREPSQLPLGISPGSGFDFEGYVCGRNQGLLQLLQQLPSLPQFIYIWGDAGAGRSHLLHAACHAVAASEQRAALLPLSDSADWQPQILEGWEALDLVALDDVQSVAGKDDWEQAIFALYNELRDHGKSLLISADRPPAAHVDMLPDLRSRLGAMLVYQLHGLDDEGRLEALARKARARGMELPEEVGRYLLARVSRDMRNLSQLIDRLDDASLARQRRLTIPFVREQLEEIARG